MKVDTYSTNRTHAVMNTSGSKTTLDDLKTSTRAKNHIRSGDANILESDMAVSVRSIIVTVDRQHPVDGDAWSVGWDQYNGLLLVWVLVSWITLAHDDINLASWITSST